MTLAIVPVSFEDACAFVSWTVRMNAETAGLTYYEIGKRLGIHQTTIRSAVLRVTWAHIDDGEAA